MFDSVFTFESEPFELAVSSPEAELQRRSARRPPPMPRSSRPRPRPGRRPLRRVVVPPIVQIAESRCPTAAVLEGYAPGSAALEPQHEDMLKRVVDFLQRPGASVGSLQVIVWSNSAEPDSSSRGIAGQRLETATARLQELLKAVNRSVSVRGSTHNTRGPERVEIRLCM